MDKKEVLVATTQEIARYTGRTCLEAAAYFDREFALRDRPFVNFLLYFRNPKNEEETISIHENYGVLTPRDYETTKSDFTTGLGRMIDFYLRSEIPNQLIQLTKPPLVITTPKSQQIIVEAFGEFEYKPKQIQRKEQTTTVSHKK
ncbi:MAG: hypothetical protein IIA87_04870 [Nanoarchaeota archaeon]|nr:hypothetical protein [Nanoarchaeota archaeon]